MSTIVLWIIQLCGINDSFRLYAIVQLIIIMTDFFNKWIGDEQSYFFEGLVLFESLEINWMIGDIDM